MSMPEVISRDKPLAIIGDEDAVLGFRVLGFKTYAVREPADFKTALVQALEEKIAICLVQDNVYNQVRDEINNYRYFALPVFVPFSKDAQTDLLDRIIKEIRLKATGAF